MEFAFWAALLGVLVGIVNANGSPVTDNGSGSDFVAPYTTGASNTVEGIVDTSLTSLWSVELDAAAGTTTGSGKYGVNIDCLAASDQLDESSVLTTTASFFSHGVDADPTAPANSVIVSIQESQIHI